MVMKKLINSISNTLAANGTISKNNIDICSYGLELFITSVFEIVAILIISIIIGNFLETVVFLAGFLPIRIYSGGYHADTRIRCFLILVIVYILFSILIYYVIMNKYIILLQMICTLSAIFILSPLHHKNKNRNDQEWQIFRKISIVLSLLECIIIILLWKIDKNSIYLTVLTLSLSAVFFSLTAGKIKNLLRKER